MSLLKHLLTELKIFLFDIGNLKIKDWKELKELSNSNVFHTDHLEGSPWLIMYKYLDTLSDLNNDGGEVYRLIIAPSDNDIKNRGVYGGESDSWTLSKGALDDIYINIMGDFLGGLFDLDDDIDFWHKGIKKDEVKVYLVTATTPPNNVEGKNSFYQFEAFPEEQEVLIKDHNKLNIISIEEYKK